MNPPHTIQLASLPDRDNVVAEGWLDGVQICEVSFEDRNLACQLFHTGLMPSMQTQPVIDAAIERLRTFHSVSSTTVVSIMHQP